MRASTVILVRYVQERMVLPVWLDELTIVDVSRLCEYFTLNNFFSIGRLIGGKM